MSYNRRKAHRNIQLHGIGHNSMVGLSQVQANQHNQMNGSVGGSTAVTSEQHYAEAGAAPLKQQAFPTVSSPSVPTSGTKEGLMGTPQYILQMNAAQQQAMSNVAPQLLQQNGHPTSGGIAF